MHKFSFIYICVLFISCSTPEQLIDYSSAPQWVQELPLSNDHYIGVGVSAKKGVSDYREQARENAFNEISSSISVSVSSNSVLQQQENNGKFKEMFNTSTKTYTNNELAGCKQVGRWENKSEYWVYYKLSKEQVAAAKRNAIEDATISLRQALNYDAQNDYPKAISNYSLALSAVKPYLGDRLKTEFNGEIIFLGQYILDHYRELITSVKLTPDSNSILTFKSFRPLAPLIVKLTRNNEILSNIPLKIASSGLKYEGTYKFNEVGEVTLPEINANTYRGKEVVVLSIDIEKMIEESVSDDLVKEVLKSYETTYLELLYRLETGNEPTDNSPTSDNEKPGGIGFPQIPNPANKIEKITGGIYNKIEKINEVKEVVIDLGNVINKFPKEVNIEESQEKESLPTIDNSQGLLGIAKQNTFDAEKIQNIQNYLNGVNKQYYTPEIREVVKQFTFEKDKLEVAKICYHYTVDKSNYYTLNSLFDFSSTKEELNNYINQQK